MNKNLDTQAIVVTVAMLEKARAMTLETQAKEKQVVLDSKSQRQISRLR